jgi:hypothetical protein
MFSKTLIQHFLYTHRPFIFAPRSIRERTAFGEYCRWCLTDFIRTFTGNEVLIRAECRPELFNQYFQLNAVGQVVIDIDDNFTDMFVDDLSNFYPHTLFDFVDFLSKWNIISRDFIYSRWGGVDVDEW